jgi:cell division protein FtsN
MTEEGSFDEKSEAEAPVRELQLEGSALYLVVGVLVVGLAAAFFTGRWYERSRTPSEVSGSAAVGTDVLFSEGMNTAAPVEEEAIEANTDFFDTIPGDGSNAEPEREAVVQKPVEEPVREAVAPPPVAASGEGPFYVQVSASRDRKAAEELNTALGHLGFRSRIQTVADGAGSLYKVQVGGFSDKNAASATVAKLEKAGYKGVWTTRVD